MEKLLVPVDGSQCSFHALDLAIDFAKTNNAEIVLCHVVDLGKAAGMAGAEPQLLEGCYEELQDEGDYIIEQATKHIGSAARVSIQKLEGAPIAEIVRLAAELQPHFIVIGSHGRTGFKRFFIGSVAEGVARGSSVPVMIVPMEHQGKIHAT